MFGFEKLEVWQRSIEFADSVYSATRDFPADERFGLTNQMRRAAVSISSNIAEGSARLSRKDFARFIEIATGSSPKPSSAKARASYLPSNSTPSTPSPKNKAEYSAASASPS